ncbi:hypothetical protein MP228_002002 [Amoeboaphelidium protococcarum]|nr:hypothetical protein MP228_002002 [Amoeboaphelidium protococcarum]
MNENSPEVMNAAIKIGSKRSHGEDTDGNANLVVMKQAKVLTLEQETMGKSWYEALISEFQKPYFQDLKKFLDQQKQNNKKIFPQREDIYSWSRHCAVDQIKAVIIGQDPYHNDGQAHGFCFSVREGVKLPPSLVNIFKEVERDIGPLDCKKYGCLQAWADQGVLLLNAVLTVEAHKANSHANKGWEQFTNAVIQVVTQKNENVVFMLWGNHAQKKVRGIDESRHLVLNTVHPSPLSARRGFFGCSHFSLANKYLSEHGKLPISWNILKKLAK